MRPSTSTSARRSPCWLAIGLLVGLTACGGAGGNATQQPGTARELLSISVSPVTATIETGGVQQFAAKAHYTDGTTADLASGVTWSSTQPAVATVDTTTGLATGIATSTGSTLITATQGGVSGTATLTVTPKAAVVESVSIEPATLSLAAGRTVSLSATAHMSDGAAVPLTTGVTWSVSPPGVASVSSTGVLNGVAAGSASVTVTHVESGVSATRQITVTSAVLESIAVTPASSSVVAGLSRQFTAIGTYSDGTSAALDAAQITWSSTAPAIASVNASGLATGIAPGATVIRATQAGATSSPMSGSASLTVQAVVMSSIAIAPTDPVASGLDAQLSVSASLTNGTSQILTSGLRFESSDPSVALVNGDGLVFALAPGQATITATHAASGLSSSRVFTVSGARLDRITLPDPLHVPAGFARPLVATGHFSDGSTAALDAGITWSSSAPTVARVNPAGVLTGVGKGTSSVTVTAPGGLSVTTQVVVTDATIVSLRLEPGGDFLRQGEDLAVSAVALFSDGLELALSPDAVIWTSSDVAVAPVVNGLVLGVAGGETMVTAQHVASGLRDGDLFYVSPVVDLAYQGDLPAAGSTGSRGTMYRVSGVTPGSWYTVTVADATSDVELSIPWGDAGCYVNQAAGVDASCVVPAVGSELLVGVSSWPAFATFTLTVEPAAAPGFTPFTVGAPASGTLSSGGDGAFFELTGLAPGYYLVTLDGLTADAGLDVYGDATRATYLCGSWSYDTRAETCAVYAPYAGSLFVGIWAPGESPFTLSARPIAAPVPVPSTALPLSTHVDGYAVFAVGGVVPGAPYDVVLEGGASADVDLLVLADANFLDQLCESRTNGGVAECLAEAKGTRLYVAVDATREAVGADITVRVTRRAP